MYTRMSPVTGWEGHGEDSRAVRALSSRKKFGVTWLFWALYEAECSWNWAEQLVSQLLSILGFCPPPFPALEAREAVGKHQTPPHFSSKAGDSWGQLGPAGLQLVDTLVPATPQPWPVTAPNSVCKGPCSLGSLEQGRITLQCPRGPEERPLHSLFPHPPALANPLQPWGPACSCSAPLHSPQVPPGTLLGGF